MKKKVIALKYDRNEPAPQIIAQGEDLFAGKILELADKEGIPVYQDDMTTELLYELNIDDYVPEDLWEIIAQIYKFVFEQNEKRLRGKQ